MVRSNADVRWLVLLCAFPARANRTAVCLAGTPRTFTRPHVFRSISENLLLALNRSSMSAHTAAVANGHSIAAAQ